MNDVAVLFARLDSPYKRFAVDVWDFERDAMQYAGPWPVIAHPPCRGWGRLRHFAKPRPGELDCGLFSAYCVRRWGGVLEHPAGSLLWAACGLPRPGEGCDEHGGFSVSVKQSRWAHGADKWTWLYVVGLDPGELPELPPDRSGARLVENMATAEREATPPALCHWLLRVAIKCIPEGPLTRAECGVVVDNC